MKNADAATNIAHVNATHFGICPDIVHVLARLVLCAYDTFHKGESIAFFGAKMEDIWFVIPAYNEGSGIGAVASEVRSIYENVVVVDDCSTGDTGNAALYAGAHVCRHPVNLGQGAALQTGWDYALKMGAISIVTFDADGQHSLSDATAIVSRLSRVDVDMVLGSRFLAAP